MTAETQRGLGTARSAPLPNERYLDHLEDYIDQMTRNFYIVVVLFVIALLAIGFLLLSNGRDEDESDL